MGFVLEALSYFDGGEAEPTEPAEPTTTSRR